MRFSRAAPLLAAAIGLGLFAAPGAYANIGLQLIQPVNQDLGLPASWTVNPNAPTNPATGGLYNYFYDVLLSPSDTFLSAGNTIGTPSNVEINPFPGFNGIAWVEAVNPNAGLNYSSFSVTTSASGSESGTTVGNGGPSGVNSGQPPVYFTLNGSTNISGASLGSSWSGPLPAFIVGLQTIQPVVVNYTDPSQGVTFEYTAYGTTPTSPDTPVVYSVTTPQATEGPAPVPEPAFYQMGALLGLAAIGGIVKKRSRR